MWKHYHFFPLLHYFIEVIFLGKSYCSCFVVLTIDLVFEFYEFPCFKVLGYFCWKFLLVTNLVVPFLQVYVLIFLRFRVSKVCLSKSMFCSTHYLFVEGYSSYSWMSTISIMEVDNESLFRSLVNKLDFDWQYVFVAYSSFFPLLNLFCLE
jgi:hypothetical protein